MLQAFFETVLLRRVFSLLVLLELGLAYVIYTNVYYIQKETGMPILDMEIGYSAGQVTDIFLQYGEIGRTRYKLIMLADLIHPAIYSSLFGGVIWGMVARPERRWIALVPFFAALFDWAENSVIWRMFSEPLPVDYQLAQIGNYLSYCKHGLVVMSVALLAWLLVRGLWRGIVR